MIAWAKYGCCTPRLLPLASAIERVIRHEHGASTTKQTKDIELNTEGAAAVVQSFAQPGAAINPPGAVSEPTPVPPQPVDPQH